MDKNLLKKMMPFVIMILVTISLFLFMLLPVMVDEKEVLPLNPKFNLYDELEYMGDDYVDINHQYDKKMKNIDVAKEQVKMFDEYIKEVDDVDEIRHLNVLKSAAHLDVTLYGSIAALVFGLSVLLILSLICIALFFVKDGLKLLNYFRHASYLMLIAVMIISCVITGAINSVENAFNGISDLLNMKVSISPKASSVVLAISFIAIIGFIFYEYLRNSHKTLAQFTSGLTAKAKNNMESNMQEDKNEPNYDVKSLSENESEEIILHAPEVVEPIISDLESYDEPIEATNESEKTEEPDQAPTTEQIEK